MNRSYKIFLASVAALCVLVIGYYVWPNPRKARTHHVDTPDRTADAHEAEERTDPGNLLALRETHVESTLPLTDTSENSLLNSGKSAIPDVPDTDRAETPTLTFGSGPSRESTLMRLATAAVKQTNNLFAGLPERSQNSTKDSAANPPAPPTHTIHPGDTLSSIATEHFGSARRWVDIAQVNPGMDARRLMPGQVIQLPPKVLARPLPVAQKTGEATRYLVRAGDTLSSITKRFYKNSEHWRLIYQANREQIGHDPDRLEAGFWLTVPPAPAVAAAERPAPKPTEEKG